MDLFVIGRLLVFGRGDQVVHVSIVDVVILLDGGI